MNYVVRLSYNGTYYGGWQKQGNTDKTIQEKLKEMLKRLNKVSVEVRGSGRIDTGVHTLTQVTDFRLNREMTPRDVMGYLNRHLPEGTGVQRIGKAFEWLHSYLNAVRRTYRYQIEMGPREDVFQRGCYYGLGLELDVKAMEQVADLLMGTRDFKSFCGNKKMKKPAVRTLKFVQFERIGDTKLHISFTGNGFLQQIVKILTDTLIEVGLRKRQSGDMSQILGAKDRQEAGFTASSQGLLLEKAEYGELRRQVSQ